jgi:metallo-beta-lactamase family protein
LRVLYFKNIGFRRFFLSLTSSNFLSPQHTMDIQFFGAARQVTGSKHLVTTNKGFRILLDCGLFQGIGTQQLNQDFGFDPSQLDCVVLSHAHIDHTGLLPRLVAKGFSGQVFCTEATRSLAELLLMDSARIQENDVARINKRRQNRGEEQLESLYEETDVQRTIELMVPMPFGQIFSITPDIQCHFTHTGHILGSAAVHLDITEDSHTHKLTFTGDIGRASDKILRSPEPFRQADYIICESTYGDKIHPPEADVKAHLLELVHRVCVEQKGKLLIPAFSVDRTQELVFALDQLEHEGKLPAIPVFVDSPLSVNATKVMGQHEECFNPEVLSYIKKDGDPFGFPSLHYVSDVAESKKINELQFPAIIISSSGMAEAGRIKHHIANNIQNPDCCILMVGYASPDSLGGALKRGDKEVRIFGATYPVKAEVVVMDSFSAHGDYQEMIAYLACQDPQKVRQLFLVHGDYDTQQIFAQHLDKAGWAHISMPDMREKVQL